MFDDKLVLHPLHIRLFFFNDTATPEIYTLSLHDALPISHLAHAPLDRAVHLDDVPRAGRSVEAVDALGDDPAAEPARLKLEEHTPELQSRPYIVCRLFLEKKNVNSMRADLIHALFKLKTM